MIDWTEWEYQTFFFQLRNEISNMIQCKHMGRQDIQMQARNTKQIISLDGSSKMNGDGNHILTTVVCGYCIYLKIRQNIFLKVEDSGRDFHTCSTLISETGHLK